MHYTFMESPIGTLLLAGDEMHLLGVYICQQKHTPLVEQGWIRSGTMFEQPMRQLQEYFAGNRISFDLSLAPNGTEFQKKVWLELSNIPYGTTCSYGELAKKVGNSNASRAVGMANGKNPISIIVPCHRVIGADGSLTGYGGGLEAKKWLLAHESKSKAVSSCASSPQ